MKKTKRNHVCYLRTHRRVWGLTQREMATLTGFKSTTHVSRIENGKRAPTVEVALACQVIFGMPPSAMFPHVYNLVEEKVMRNIYRLHLALKNTTNLTELRKRELFSLALKRAVDKPNTLRGT
jgi:transcriptional regulator with XRE-family HTH domain